MKIYTRDGDDGSTGLYFGGRTMKSSDPIEVNGAVDEAQASLGWARSLAEPSSRLYELLITLERDLWVLMAEVAPTLEAAREKCWRTISDGSALARFRKLVVAKKIDAE